MFVFSESTPCTRMNDFFSIRKDGANTASQVPQPSARLLCHLGRDNLLQDPQRYALLCRTDGIIGQQLMQENMASPPNIGHKLWPYSSQGSQFVTHWHHCSVNPRFTLRIDVSIHYQNFIIEIRGVISIFLIYLPYSLTATCIWLHSKSWH